MSGDPEGEAVAALPPRRRSGRDPLLERMQAMTSALEPLPDRRRPDPARVTYLVNPRLEMSSGKTLAQIAHAAVMAADTGALEDWVAAGCPARVRRAAAQRDFDALCGSDRLAAKVVDGGLTEVAPGTVTVLALPPRRRGRRRARAARGGPETRPARSRPAGTRPGRRGPDIRGAAAREGRPLRVGPRVPR